MLAWIFVYKRRKRIKNSEKVEKELSKQEETAIKKEKINYIDLESNVKSEEKETNEPSKQRKADSSEK